VYMNDNDKNNNIERNAKEKPNEIGGITGQDPTIYGGWQHKGKQIKILPYKPEELFNLVLDVKSYPEFLPWCQAARIILEDNNQIIAELVIQLKGFSDKYQSRIIYCQDQIYSIDVEAISGPFKYLKNSWKFSKENTGTKLEFDIDFKMKLAIVDRLVETFFSEATQKIVNAFEKRAKTLLGSNKVSN
ncbi:Ribosome association toxin RatA, partial [Pseudolycoriella hygida]